MDFIDLEKAYDKVPKDIIWWVLKKKCDQRYNDAIKDMYYGLVIMIGSPASETSEFSITLRLCQGSNLNPYLFALVMYESTKHIHDVPWSMLFTDNIVLVDEINEGINIRIEYVECNFSDIRSRNNG